MTLKLQAGREEEEGLVTLKLQVWGGGGASDTQTAGREEEEGLLISTPGTLYRRRRG